MDGAGTLAGTLALAGAGAGAGVGALAGVGVGVLASGVDETLAGHPVGFIPVLGGQPDFSVVMIQ